MLAGKELKMKRNKDKAILFTFFFLLPLLYTTAQGMQQESKGKIIDMGSYSIQALPGEDWKAEIKKEEESVSFVKEEKEKTLGFLPGRTKRLTNIIIRRNEVSDPGKWHLSKEEVANDYVSGEEKDMVERGVKTGQYELTDVKKGVTTIGDKTLYFMNYKTTSVKQGSRGEAILYLYFPPDFKKTHNFYLFLITEAYPLDNPVIDDLSQINPVINSFKIITPAVSQKGILPSEIGPFQFEKRLYIYEAVDKIANRLLKSSLYKVLKEKRTGTFKDYPILKLVDRDGDGKADEFLYFPEKGERTQEFGFIFDLNGDGKIDYIVFNGGPLFSKDFKKMIWMNYHWIDSNYDGKQDIFVYNDVDLDGDGFFDEGITAWIYDRDFNGTVDEDEYLGRDFSKLIEKKDGILIVKTALREYKWKTDDKGVFSHGDKIFSDINSMLP